MNRKDAREAARHEIGAPPDAMARISSGYTRPMWLLEQPLAFDRLEHDLEVDVVIVGAGLAGASAAYLLACEGRRVALLDDGCVGSGETGRTTAHITWALDSLYGELVDLFGRDDARLAAESHRQAIEQIAQVVHQEGINCDFERLDGVLFLADQHTQQDLKKELDTLRDLGFEDVLMREQPPGQGSALGSCLIYPNQAQFHPMLYLRGLCEGILKRGGRIFTDTRVTGGMDDTGVTVEGGLRVTAKHVVIATNSPINDLLKMHTKQAPYRSYVITATVPRGAVSRALYWDMGSGHGRTDVSYHYVRLQPWFDDQDLMIIGGCDHKTGQADDAEVRWQALERWACRNFAAVGPVVHRWSGQVLNPVDALGFIGPNRSRGGPIIITGHSGNGMTYSTIAGLMVRDMVLGRENAWSGLYAPSRKTMGSIGDFAAENLNVAKEYSLWLRQGERIDPQQLDIGQGAVVHKGRGTRAAYRDENGQLRIMKTACTHLKCMVRWNSAERTFDCPCHGSRFTGLGTPVNGPAYRGLEEK